MRYKQTEPYGCGLYATANACNLDTFVTDERILKSKDNGNTIGQLSKWLQEDGLNFYIEVLFYDHLGKNIPESTFDYRPIGDVDYLPILITCRLSENGLNHMIGGKIDKNGTLYLYDSLKSEVEVTELKAINDKYHNVYGLYIFADVTNGNYAFL